MLYKYQALCVLLWLLLIFNMVVNFISNFLCNYVTIFLFINIVVIVSLGLIYTVYFYEQMLLTRLFYFLAGTARRVHSR